MRVKLYIMDTCLNLGARIYIIQILQLLNKDEKLLSDFLIGFHGIDTPRDLLVTVRFKKLC